jgi:hypothetical protein
MLLGGATDIRALKGRELDQEKDRQLRLLDLMTRTEKAERPTTTLSATYMKDGKLVKDRIVNGEVVGQVQAPPNESGVADPGGRWFQSADGQVRYFTGSNPPPAGWGAVEDPTTAALRDILVGDKLNARDSKLAGYEATIKTGKDKDGIEVAPETMQIYKDLYNKQNPEAEFVEQVTPPLTIGGWKVPFTGKKELVKVPKESKDAGEDPGGAPPVGTVDSGYKFKGGNPADPNNWEKM